MIPSERIVWLARHTASLSGGKYRLGAVIYDGRNICGSGFNQPNKTHPKSPVPYKTKHAEFDALLSASRGAVRDLRGLSIYVHRILKDGSAGLAKPCRYCQVMLSWAGINDIHYSGS